MSDASCKPLRSMACAPAKAASPFTGCCGWGSPNNMYIPSTEAKNTDAAVASGKRSQTLGLAGAGMASRLCNLFISNVPGPQLPLYMNGAEQVGTYGLAPLVNGMGLFIATPSYNGQLTFNVTSTRDILPDIDFFVAVVGSVFAQVHAVGDHPDIAANERNIGPELGRLCAVDLDFPLNAGNRAAVLYVDETADLRQTLIDLGRGAVRLSRHVCDRVYRSHIYILAVGDGRRPVRAHVGRSGGPIVGGGLVPRWQ